MKNFGAGILEYSRSPVALLTTSVLCTSVFRRVKQLVSAEGLEPSTNGLKGRLPDSTKTANIQDYQAKAMALEAVALALIVLFLF